MKSENKMAGKYSKFDDDSVAETLSIMVGVGVQYDGLIDLAVKRTNLTDTQVKVTCHIKPCMCMCMCMPCAYILYI